MDSVFGSLAIIILSLAVLATVIYFILKAYSYFERTLMKTKYKVTATYSACVPVSVNWTCSRCGQLNHQEGTHKFTAEYKKIYSYYGSESTLTEDKKLQGSLDKEDFETKWSDFFQHPGNYPEKLRVDLTLSNPKCCNCKKKEGWGKTGLFVMVVPLLFIVGAVNLLIGVFSPITSSPARVIILLISTALFGATFAEQAYLNNKVKKKNPGSMCIITPDLKSAVISIRTQTYRYERGHTKHMETEDTIL